jgi:glycosyltransferase involved in cell wall biosynthesis
LIKVLHITAHLGGGVGKALSGLVACSESSRLDVQHTIVCLEQPEKTQFIDLIRNRNCEVFVSPDALKLKNLIVETDIVQLEWWNHPAIFACLCGQALPPMRLMVWSHVSGLYNPVIPPKLPAVAQKFLFTSPCSFESKEVQALDPNVRIRLGVVSSSGGFDNLPLPADACGDRLSVGYFGSLNFAKLHPHYVNFLKAVKDPRFSVKVIGDVTNKAILERQCEQAGRPGMLDFHGYTSDAASALSSLNVLAYLLNPEHYGTTENALLEAMAMGIVPIVLNNPAERFIVDDHNTGLIVSSPEEFAEAVSWLKESPDELGRMGRQAAESVRNRFAVEKMEATFASHYRTILTSEKKTISFFDIFGKGPAEWFLSCQRNPQFFSSFGTAGDAPGEFSIYGLLERTKGTVFHFSDHFPENNRLSEWAKRINEYRQLQEGNLT